MQFYKRNKSGSTWQRDPFISLLHLLRDTIVFFLPVKRIPRFIVKVLYGIYPKFIFFVHARRTEDIWIALPFLVPFRRFLGRKLFTKISYLFPPFVLDTIHTDKGTDGLVVTSIFLSEILLINKRIALREGLKGLFFSAKIARKGAIFGLGGLWPMLTRRGLILNRYSDSRGIIVTNGHCGTLVSLFLSIKKIAELGDIALDQLKVVILGVGKMGFNLAHALYGKVATLTLVDIKDTRINRVEEKLKKVMAKTDIQKYTNHYDIGGIEEIFANNHICICTTSNVRHVLKSEQIPSNTIIIDDSRPEGIPRQLNQPDRIVIEGGLMKIKGLRQTYDFGFGIDENVFGCLAESFLLAADKSNMLRPTLGEVDIENFERMILACDKLGVSIGDFKCRDEGIDEKRLISILKSKTGLAATIPFKKICWIFKVEELEGLFNDKVVSK